MAFQAQVPVISIEGNIGCGKSTMLEKVKMRFQDKPEIVFIPEPVNEWRKIKDKQGVDLLTNFYKDQEKFSFHFQMAAYISRVASITQASQNPNTKLIVIERSIWTDKNVFAKMLYDDEKITLLEYNIYLRWFDEFSKLINHVSNLYIRTDPTVAFQRVKKRSRSGETIPIEYLTRCHQYHDVWLRENSTIINGDIELPKETNIDLVESHINNIYDTIQN